MKSLIRLCLNASGELCRDTDPGAAQLIAPIGDPVPEEHRGAYAALFGEGEKEPSEDPVIEKTVAVEGAGDLVKVDGRWGVASDAGPKWLDRSNKVDLQTICTLAGLEIEGTKAELLTALEAWAEAQ